jgi:hypothetical protein
MIAKFQLLPNRFKISKFCTLQLQRVKKSIWQLSNIDVIYNDFDDNDSAYNDFDDNDSAYNDKT